MNTFVDVISENAERHPNKTALVDESGSYTYQELDRLSNGVAAKLIGQGIGTGDIVPILMSRGKAFVAAFIGVMKSGAAFVPLDINYPEERIKSIEESVEARIFIDDEWMNAISPSVEFINNSKPDDMAFIIFTSGSTGKPKGVAISHNALMKRASSISSAHDNTNGGIGLMTNFIFSACMDELSASIFHHRSIYIVPDNVARDVNLLYNYIVNNHITSFAANPNLVKVLMSTHTLKDVCIRMMGDRCIGPFPKLEGKYINAYGCSEMGYSIFNHFTEHNNGPVSIGKPSDNVKAFILLNGNKIAKDNEIGELCLVGPQMASGYWKMPDLTAEKFVHCPFLPGDVKMYKTGDLARYREDGNIELVGRKDFQIKIRGFRIEPGEIENVAVKFDGIDTVVVVAKEMGAEKQLVLYYTSNEQVDEPKLKEYLSRYLADYMVPNFYVRLDEMPRNVNGKIDRSALPESQRLSRSEKDSDKPSTELERMIFKAVAKQIGTEDFGINDDLISLGLTSLSSILVAAEMGLQGVGLSASKQGVSFYNEIVLARNIKELVKRLNSEG